MVQCRLSSRLGRGGMGDKLKCYMILCWYWSGIIYTLGPDEGSWIYRSSDHTILELLWQLSWAPSIVCTDGDKVRALGTGCSETWTLPHDWQAWSAFCLAPIPVWNGIPNFRVMILLRNHIPKCLTWLLFRVQERGQVSAARLYSRILFWLNSG